METTVDNSLASTGYLANSNTCPNTTDKIYLPSYSEVTNAAYKFSSDPLASDPYRIKMVTDYARATGAWTNMSEWDGNTGSGIWMLRSPADSSSIFIREGYYIGDVTDGGINISNTAHGVAPMLRLADKDVQPVYNMPIRKGALKVPGYTFAASTYNNVYIYTPQTYYTEGDTITVTFNTVNVPNPRIVMTTDTIGTAGQYGDIWIRDVAIPKTERGTVDISNKTYDTSHTVDLKWIESQTKWNVDDLPPGEYKIWLFNSANATAGFSCEMYKANSSNQYLVTEPISIKILPKDEEDLDLSITHYSDWKYQGTNYDDPNRINWTSLTIDKTVFEEGEKIYFHIDGSWEHKWIAVIKADQFTTGTVIESHPDKEKYMRYVKYGHQDYISEGKNYLETEGLEPGQYKIIYVFGETFEKAWSYATANFQNHSPTPQKVVTIMDITILPSD
jgi:hypothetical protein